MGRKSKDRNPPKHRKRKQTSVMGSSIALPREQPASWQQWGDDIDPEAILQMERACQLPVSIRGALMADAHVGYGLPIGGVLAVRDAVIPWAVGVDIACRMKMSVLDWPAESLATRQDALEDALLKETRFGVGAEWHPRRQHPVMDRDWSVSPVTRTHKDKAWAQLGTSGSGNHFVEFGELEVWDEHLTIPPGRYLALLSHSGSRGTGALVCEHYSRVARERLRQLPPELSRLAWLPLHTQEGWEYWQAMHLMGEYAAANHALIHEHILKRLGAVPIFTVENHHNYAWKENLDGEEVIVHRKGATPAGTGCLGIIPGSMASPAYLVRGKGNPASLNSAAHGAGRKISRSQAKRTFRWSDFAELLRKRGVKVLRAGIDEVPAVYKDIETVMRAQQDLVEPLARFYPRLVMMAPAGERPED